ncbi:Carboxymuconolactone decarboxylase [Mycobacteroides abscessus]|nr:Carboxymuconolactone decarboxylase [Mycobacteroides abscessus]
MYDQIFGDRDPVADPGTTTGTPGDWWTVFALVPDALKHSVQGFAFYRSPDRKLDPVLRELGQTRAGGRGAASSSSPSIASPAAWSA